MVEDYYVNNKTGLTKMSTDVLERIANVKVDAVKAKDPTTALVIFVYDTEYKHNVFQLCVYRNQTEDRNLIWRPFIDNKLGQVMRTYSQLKEFIGNYLFVEIADMNLDDELKRLVEENKITNEEYKHITDKDNKVPPQMPNIDPGMLGGLMGGMMGGAGDMLGGLAGMMGGMNPIMNPQNIIDAEPKKSTDSGIILPPN